MDCNGRAELAPLYFSGEMDAARAAEFAAHLASCEACARVMEQHAEIETRLREEIFGEPLDPSALELRIAQNLRRSSALRWVGVAAGIAAMLVIAVVGYRAQAGAKLATEAAQDHHREVVDREQRIWATDLSAVEMLAARAGVPVRTLDLPGYRLERAKLCRLGASRFLHLVYSDGTREVSLFLGPPRTAGSARIDCTDHGAEHVAEFHKSGTEALVVTGESDGEALRLARSAESML